MISYNNSNPVQQSQLASTWPQQLFLQPEPHHCPQFLVVVIERPRRILVENLATATPSPNQLFPRQKEINSYNNSKSFPTITATVHLYDQSYNFPQFITKLIPKNLIKPTFHVIFTFIPWLGSYNSLHMHTCTFNFPSSRIIQHTLQRVKTNDLLAYINKTRDQNIVKLSL